MVVGGSFFINNFFLLHALDHFEEFQGLFSPLYIFFKKIIILTDGGGTPPPPPPPPLENSTIVFFLILP